MLKGEVNPTIEQIAAVVRAYEGNLADFLEPFATMSTTTTKRLVANCRQLVAISETGGPIAEFMRRQIDAHYRDLATPKGRRS
jgi:hypothetical protein